MWVTHVSCLSLLHRSINWPRTSQLLRNTQPRSWSGPLFLLLLRLSVKQRKAGPLKTTCSFSGKHRSSETAWNKTTSPGKHEILWKTFLCMGLWYYSWLEHKTPLCFFAACFPNSSNGLLYIFSRKWKEGIKWLIELLIKPVKQWYLAHRVSFIGRGPVVSNEAGVAYF